jgi:hypothetical protein
MQMPQDLDAQHGGEQFSRRTLPSFSQLGKNRGEQTGVEILAQPRRIADHCRHDGWDGLAAAANARGYADLRLDVHRCL